MRQCYVGDFGDGLRGGKMLGLVMVIRSTVSSRAPSDKTVT